MDKKLEEFFKECMRMKNSIGGCVMVAKNKETGYGCNGIFQLEKVEDGYKLVKDVDSCKPEFLEYIFNADTIKKFEFGARFGKYANLYLDDTNYIHMHMHLLD